MRKITHFFIEYKYFLLVVFISLLSVVSLFQPGLPPTHDGEYHVVRFYEFDKTLREGNWYPLWASDLNYTYGSPLFNYIYPLPNYAASLFHFFTLSFIDAFKANLVTASLVGGIGMYFYARKRFGEPGGVVSAVFYTFSPYHFLDMYIRGSVGEVWALALFPLGLFMFDRIVKTRKTRDIALGAVVYALVVFSHNILAVMFSAFLGSYILLLVFEEKERREAFVSCVVAVLLGLLVSAVFFLPALLEQKYVIGLNTFNVNNNFPELFQLLIPSWGSGFSGGSLSNEMSFQIGVANLLVVGIVLFALLFKKNKKGKVLPIFFLGWFFLLFFLITPFSSGIWTIISPMNYFQFPWRFLSLVILCSSILAGYATTLIRKKVFAIFLLVIVLLTTYSYAHPAYFMQRTDNYYMTRPNFIYGTNSIGDGFQTRWLNQQKSLPEKNLNEVVGKSTYHAYSLTRNRGGIAVFDIAYFPNWMGYIDGKKVAVKNLNGKVSLEIPSGKHLVELRLEDTFVRSAGKLLSFVGVALALVLLWKNTVIQYFYARRH
ncbi:MAG: 6-pyruvoyl-tetrahydropterin synthase-related protein [Candidatus Levyibacteriota bacterium]